MVPICGNATVSLSLSVLAVQSTESTLYLCENQLEGAAVIFKLGKLGW